MTERATFKYTGPEQHIRIGSETFRRHIDTLVTDPDVIAEARAHPEVEEDGGVVAGFIRTGAAREEDAPATEPVTKLAAKPPKARVRKPKAAKKK